jgi:hypothetical protein
MDMSKAALPPRSASYSKQDEQHPLFPLYRQYAQSRTHLMIDCEAFRDWLFSYERQQRDESFMAHPRFAEFQQWMRDNQAGARPCCPTRDLPRGVSFPANFVYWLDGGRW